MGMGAPHKKLFAAYVRDLTDALKLAKRDPPPNLPTAAHPRVLGVVIEFFFRCQKLNVDIEKEGGTDAVSPIDFVLDMLTGKHEALYDALSELPYMPHGLDKEDEWV